MTVYRLPPPNRRAGITQTVNYAPPGTGGRDMRIIVTFGYDPEGVPKRIVEAFCASFRADSEVVALANDAMILMSHLLQRGVPIESLAASMGVNTDTNVPTSIIGAILRTAVVLDRELRES